MRWLDLRICFIGSANSAHIAKWCNWFSKHNHEIHVISFIQGKIEKTIIHVIEAKVDPNGSDIAKLKYLLTGNEIKQLIEKIKPDVINVHYASSYGVAVALSGIKGYILSVWGSDIYDFPRRSFFHKLLLKYSLKRAECLFSTSNTMAIEASKYTDKNFIITPFGVDMELFNPNKRKREQDIPFTIGTVKSMTDLYGIDYILKAVALIRNEEPDIDISARISGDGPQIKKYQRLANELGIEDITVFLGRISQNEAAVEWANMDVAVIPSIQYESFGVAAVEAQASCTPVIISDVEGLMETTNPGITSIVVPRKNEMAIARAIIKLYKDRILLKQMGIEARKNVIEKYELNQNFEYIEQQLRKHMYNRLSKK